MLSYERLEELRVIKGITQAFLCKLVGKERNYISTYCKRGLNIPISFVQKWAEALDTTPEYLMGETDDPTPYPGIPVTDLEFAVIEHVAIVAAGYSQTADVDVLEKMVVPADMLHGYPPNECKAITVKGDSMYPKYENGDRVIYHAQTSVDSGSVAVIQYNGEEVTLKRVIYRTGEDWLRLEPLNPMYPPVEIRDEELELCRVYGLVISSMRL